jgi:hypothetical protein
MPDTTDAITKDELAEALAQIPIIVHEPRWEFNCIRPAYPRELAYALIAYAKAHREPEYEDHGIYQDACGNVWMYFEPDPDGEWTEPVWNAIGDANTYPYDEPARPLSKLVAEII